MSASTVLKVTEYKFYTLFFSGITGDVVFKSRSMLSVIKIPNMLKFTIIVSIVERLCKDCSAAQKLSYVRGHFRVINDKKVYVKPHYRKR